jgi:hypothetical protein
MATIFSISVVWIHHYFKVVRNQPRPKGLANEKEAFGNASRKIAQSPVSKLLLASHYSCELRLLSTPLLADRPSCHHSNHSYVFPRSRVESQPLQPLLLRSTKEDQDVTASNEPQEVRTPDRSVPTNSKKTEPLFVLPSPSEQGEARSPASMSPPDFRQMTKEGTAADKLRECFAQLAQLKMAERESAWSGDVSVEVFSGLSDEESMDDVGFLIGEVVGDENTRYAILEGVLIFECRTLSAA